MTGVGTDAVYEILEALVRLALLVTDIVLAPEVAAVYVNVAVVTDDVRVAEVGAKVPPLPPSDGVTTTDPNCTGLSVPTVKLVDA